MGQLARKRVVVDVVRRGRIISDDTAICLGMLARSEHSQELEIYFVVPSEWKKFLKRRLKRFFKKLEVSRLWIREHVHYVSCEAEATQTSPSCMLCTFICDIHRENNYSQIPTVAQRVAA